MIFINVIDLFTNQIVKTLSTNNANLCSVNSSDISNGIYAITMISESGIFDSELLRILR